ncbi:MAG: hypothetical protein P8L85_17355 [Rubripirellula sp.]|nr:hypothetical protein [Rubripirellula sp.]
MSYFELRIAEAVVTDGNTTALNKRLVYAIPDAAERLLQPILEPYGQDPYWYFDKLETGTAPAPWAIACFDREYDLAGHVVTTRPAGADIRFAAYQPSPKRPTSDFIPGLGALIFFSKTGLREAAATSPLFATAWESLQDCSAHQNWLTLLPPLSDPWLSKALRIDHRLWNEHLSPDAR